MYRYAITDRSQYGESESARKAGLLQQAARLASSGVDFIQLREKDLAAIDLIGVAREIVQLLRTLNADTRLLINSRADIAAAVGTGLHLPSGDTQLTIEQARQVLHHQSQSGPTSAFTPVISISCHTFEEVERARNSAADLILFGPVFGKTHDGKLLVHGLGLDALKTACIIAQKTPVLALGGITHENIPLCLEAGASGIAAIRLFR